MSESESQRVFQELVTAVRDQALCEYALNTARLKMEAAASDLEEANSRVERAQQELGRLARRGTGLDEPQQTGERPLTNYIPVRR